MHLLGIVVMQTGLDLIILLPRSPQHDVSMEAFPCILHTQVTLCPGQLVEVFLIAVQMLVPLALIFTYEIVIPIDLEGIRNSHADSVLVVPFTW